MRRNLKKFSFVSFHENFQVVAAPAIAKVGYAAPYAPAIAKVGYASPYAGFHAPVVAPRLAAPYGYPAYH